jgi:hypothetical protein
MKNGNNHINICDLESVVSRYPWWNGARLAVARKVEAANYDAATRLVAMLHPTALIPCRDIDASRLTHLTTDDLIDRFLKRGDYRIVAEEGAADDLATSKFEDEDEMISEDLAEIYKNQGLYSDAIEIYRKLSLLNSEKSIYFAELIAEIEGKKDRK